MESRPDELLLVDLDSIRVADRVNNLSRKDVDEIAESIKLNGLINPITVRPDPTGAFPYLLVAGNHRREGTREAGQTKIKAIVKHGLSEAQAKMLEVDENLKRGTLSAVAKTLHIKERKKAYEELHPETKAGGDRRSKRARSKAKNERMKGFVADTAARTGEGRSTLQRVATNASRIDDEVLNQIEDTSLNNGAELEALGKLKPEEQKKLAKRAKAGEKVSARKGVTAPAPAPLDEKAAAQEEQERFDRAIIAAADDTRKLLAKFKNWQDLEHAPDVVIRTTEAADVWKLLRDGMLEKQNKARQKAERMH
jgi:ParB-like chromosome segregation protein Spo0J